jgi:hypothetical protein
VTARRDEAMSDEAAAWEMFGEGLRDTRKKILKQLLQL